eukprot:1947512-Amphidinium_carterae.1
MSAVFRSTWYCYGRFAGCALQSDRGQPPHCLRRVADLSSANGEFVFDSEDAWEAHLSSLGALPMGFNVGVSTFDFKPVEMPGYT